MPETSTQHVNFPTLQSAIDYLTLRYRYLPRSYEALSVVLSELRKEQEAARANVPSTIDFPKHSDPGF